VAVVVADVEVFVVLVPVVLVLVVPVPVVEVLVVLVPVLDDELDVTKLVSLYISNLFPAPQYS